MSGWWSTAPIAGGAGLCEYFYSDAAGGIGAWRSIVLVAAAAVGSLGYLWMLCLHPSDVEPNEFGRTDIPPDAPHSTAEAGAVSRQEPGVVLARRQFGQRRRA